MKRERTRKVSIRWASAGVIMLVAAVIAVPRCQDDRPRIAADMESLAARIGTPLPNMLGQIDCCRRGYEGRFVHPPAAPEVIAWYLSLADRVACDSFELSDLETPRDGYAEWYEFECSTIWNGRGYIVSVRSLVFPHEGWTTISMNLRTE